MRWDPVQKVWSIVAPERGKRKGSFAQCEKEQDNEASYCPFCAENDEIHSHEILRVADPSRKNPWLVKVLPNKYPLLRIEGSLNRWSEGLYDVVEGIGAHEVIVEAPDCETDFASMTVEHRTEVLKVYRSRIIDLKRDTRFRYILVFKNHGRQAGALQDHSLSQIVALPERPVNLQTMLSVSREHYNRKERCLFCDILRQEREDGTRIIYEDDMYTAYVPFASSHPFELIIIPRTHSHDFSNCTDQSLNSLSRALGDVLERINRTLNSPPYNMVLITAPPPSPKLTRPDYWDSLEHDFHWHIRITPRITIDAGFEWGTGFYINPVAPEEAARHLRNIRTHRE